MSHKASENHRYPIDKINPFIPIINPLPGEYWKELTEKEISGILPYYAISNYGRIVHIYENKFMSLSWDGPGYVIAVLRTLKGSRTFRVHRLVMVTFRYFNGCEKYLVDHINGDKQQNWIDVPIFNPMTQQYELHDNLRWSSKSENLKFRYNDPAQIKFANLKRNADTNINKETAKQICELLSEGKTINEVADITNTTYNIVACIKNRYSWKDVSKDYKFPMKEKNYRKDRSINEEQVKQICELLEKGIKMKDILDAVNLNYNQRHFIYSIKNHECYTDISKNYKF